MGARKAACGDRASQETARWGGLRPRCCSGCTQLPAFPGPGIVASGAGSRRSPPALWAGGLWMVASQVAPGVWCVEGMVGGKSLDAQCVMEEVLLAPGWMRNGKLMEIR